MLTSASAPLPNAAMPVAADGSSPQASASDASDFLALLGAAKAAAKKAKGKAAGIAAVTAQKPPAGTKATGAKPETPAALLATAAETAKPGAAPKIASPKAAAEAKAEGEAAKAQQVTALPSAILAALAAGARAKDAAAASDAALATPTGPAPEDAARPKGKPARPVTRREGAETAPKSETARPTEAAHDAAKAARAEAQPVTPPAAKPADTAPAAITVTASPDADPQARALTGEPQVTDARIPLATREAAQAGFAAPVLAMRVVTKDGVTKSIEIRLDPAELGQVDVKLETGHDGKLKAVLSAENAEAFELLKKESGALEAALREAGIDLEDGAVTFALTDPGTDQSHQREAAYHGAEARRSASAGELAAAAAVETSSWRNGVIDISV